MRAQTWSLATLAGAAVLASGLARATAQPPAAPASAAAPAKPVALVNGEPITWAELDAILNRDGPKAVQPTPTQLHDMRMAALSQMIDQVLLMQFLRQQGPRVNPAEVDRALAELTTALKKDGKTLADFLRESAQTEAQVKEDIAGMLQWRDYVKARVTDEDLKRYYGENKDFFDRVMVHCSHIVVRVPPTANDAERQHLRDKLLSVRQEIVSGKLDFAAAAKKYSECPSAPQGGDIGYIQRKGQVDEAFARAAFALQAGQVSDVVQSSYGLHLIKVTERTAAQPSDFAKIKEAVQEIYVLELRQSLIAQMSRTAKVEINLP